MPLRSILTLATLLTLSVTTLGCATVATPAGVATAPPPSVNHATPPRALTGARHVHRLDFVVSTTDPSKPAVSSSYTVNLEEGEHGEVRVGSNVALSSVGSSVGPVSQARVDVGLSLRFGYTMVGDDLLLHDNLEMSSADDLPSIRKIAAAGEAVIAPGSAAVVVTSVEEPLSHKRYQVTVAATKLR